MTTEEMNAIFSLADINKDGKLNYAEVSLWCAVASFHSAAFATWSSVSLAKEEPTKF